MPSQQAIDRFTLAFHREALMRVRSQPGLLQEAAAVLDRWEERGMSASSQGYRDEWRTLLSGGVQALERALFMDADHAATLRNMSPLGFVLDDTERQRIRQDVLGS